MSDERAIREHLSRLLAWGDAHVDFDRAVAGIPVPMRGKRPAKLPYSPWELVEHMRIAQHDILDFCVNPDYREMKWPDDYWPASPAPRPAGAWSVSLRKFRQDREALQRLTMDPAVDLTARIPHGTGQTFIREIILVADHTAYHVGQLVLVRRLLGIWKEN
jgi:hypothetical protein